MCKYPCSPARILVRTYKFLKKIFYIPNQSWLTRIANTLAMVLFTILKVVGMGEVASELWYIFVFLRYCSIVFCVYLLVTEVSLECDSKACDKLSPKFCSMFNGTIPTPTLMTNIAPHNITLGIRNPDF